MNYKKIYDQIIETAKKRVNDGYVEKHHIIPKCLGGSNDEENLVCLTAREHFVCHRLLTKIYPGNNKLWMAVWAMCQSSSSHKRDYVISSRIYEQARIKRSEYIRDWYKDPDNKEYHRKRIKEWFEDPANKEYQRQRCIDWYNDNKEYHRQKRIDWHKDPKNKEYHRQRCVRKTPEDRERQRRKMLDYWSKLSKEERSATKDKIKGKNHHMFKGYWHTPNGKYESYMEAANDFGMNPESYRKYCNNSDKIITHSMASRSNFFSMDDIGKTIKETGFYLQKI